MNAKIMPGTTIETPRWAEEMQARAAVAQAALDSRYGAQQAHQGHPAACRCPGCMANRQAQFEKGGI